MTKRSADTPSPAPPPATLEVSGAKAMGQLRPRPALLTVPRSGSLHCGNSSTSYCDSAFLLPKGSF